MEVAAPFPCSILLCSALQCLCFPFSGPMWLEEEGGREGTVGARDSMDGAKSSICQKNKGQDPETEKSSTQAWHRHQARDDAEEW